MPRHYLLCVLGFQTLLNLLPSQSVARERKAKAKGECEAAAAESEGSQGRTLKSGGEGGGGRKEGGGKEASSWMHPILARGGRGWKSPPQLRGREGEVASL